MGAVSPEKMFLFSPSKWCILMHSEYILHQQYRNCHYDVHMYMRILVGQNIFALPILFMVGHLPYMPIMFLHP